MGNWFTRLIWGPDPEPPRPDISRPSPPHAPGLATPEQSVADMTTEMVRNIIYDAKAKGQSGSDELIASILENVHKDISDKVAAGQEFAPSDIALRYLNMYQHIVASAQQQDRQSFSDCDDDGLKSYPVNLVGEQYCGDAPGRCIVGDRVLLVHELGNPYDDEALMAINEQGERLGYVPADSWLRDAVFGEAKGCSAVIRSAANGAKGHVEVVLGVTMDGTEIGERQFDG